MGLTGASKPRGFAVYSCWGQKAWVLQSIHWRHRDAVQAADGYHKGSQYRVFGFNIPLPFRLDLKPAKVRGRLRNVCRKCGKTPCVIYGMCRPCILKKVKLAERGLK